MNIRGRIKRADLELFFGKNSRLLRAFEDQAAAVDANSEGLQTTASETKAINEATVIVLSSNDAFSNERVLELGQGLTGADTGSKLQLRVSDTIPIINGGFKVFLTVSGDSSVLLPLSGTLATRQNAETLENKTLAAPKISGIADYADDTAAAAGGVPVGGMYRTGSALKVRVT